MTSNLLLDVESLAAYCEPFARVSNLNAHCQRATWFSLTSSWFIARELFMSMSDLNSCFFARESLTVNPPQSGELKQAIHYERSVHEQLVCNVQIVNSLRENCSLSTSNLLLMGNCSYLESHQRAACFSSASSWFAATEMLMSNLLLTRVRWICDCERADGRQRVFFSWRSQMLVAREGRLLAALGGAVGGRWVVVAVVVGDVVGDGAVARAGHGAAFPSPVARGAAGTSSGRLRLGAWGQNKMHH